MAAACLCLLVLCSWQYLFTPTGTVRIQINPDVTIDVNALDYVIGIEGRNADGEKLIEDLNTFGKKVDEITAVLGDRAVTMGYLSEGGNISLSAQSENKRWNNNTETRLQKDLENHFHDKITVTVGTTKANQAEHHQIDKPIPPPTSAEDRNTSQ